MRRLALIATLALLIAPASAQMRFGGGSGMAGRSGGLAPHGFVGAQGRRFGGPAWSRLSPGFGSRLGRGFDGRFRHHHHLFRRPLGFGFWGYPVWGYYESFFGDYSLDQSDYYTATGNYRAAIYDQQAAIEQRLDRIEDRLNRLLDRLASPPPPPAPPQSTPLPKPQPMSAATVVFRDGHTEEVENYAVVGQTLWIFNEQRAHKVPLAQINVEATDQANQQRGIDLHLPTS